MAEFYRLMGIVTKSLKEIDNTSRILDAMKGQEQQDLLEYTVFEGINQLVNRFNMTMPGDYEYTILPHVQALKMKIAGEIHDSTLPYVEDLSFLKFKRGLQEAVPLMERGQAMRRGDVFSPEEQQAAIGTPSMPTEPFAVAVGTALHLYERTIMAYFRDKGIQNWQKDDVLFALEEIALYMHIQHKTDPEFPDSLLFKLIVQPNSEGGLGWRSEKDVAKLRHAITEIPAF